MGRRTTELILHEPARPISYKPVAYRPDHATLACSRSHVELLKAVEASHTVIDRTRRDDLHHAILQRLSARHDDPDADRTFAVESLKILQITIKERGFVVPFNFQGDGAIVGSSHMVDFM